MRILHVIGTADPVSGGPIHWIFETGKILTAQGHQIELVTVDAPDNPYVTGAPIKTYGVGPGSGGYGYASGLVPWVRENRDNYDAVVIHGVWDYCQLGAYRGLRGGKVPFYGFPHGMLDPWFNEAFPLKKIKKNLYWRWGAYPMLRDSKFVLFTTEEEAILARASFRPYQIKEQVINYGTNIAAYDAPAAKAAFLAAFPECEGKRLILYLSRIHVKKGCDLLLEAFADVYGNRPDYHLVMAGPDQTGIVPGLQAQAAQLGITDQITWTGMVKGDLKWGAYEAAEVFILPSHQENFGLVVAEALAIGRPVLTTKKVNTWREVVKFEAGFVDTDTADGVKKIVRQWDSLSDDEKQAMSARAKLAYAEHFTSEKSAEDLIRVLSQP